MIAESPELAAVEKGPAARMLSIDVLRGFDMFWIAGGEELVHGLDKAAAMSGAGPGADGAAVHHNPILQFFATQLQHVAWEGFRFYDLIFPLFLFLIGVSITFSLGRIVREEGLAAAHRRVFKRFVIMFLLGVFYYGGFANAWVEPDGSHGMRLVGVLQRLALGYLFASLLFLHFRVRGMAVALGVVLVGYWALMSFVPAPGEPAVSFAPGHNLANYIDLHYLPGRMNDKVWDPEGLLSTIPAVGTALLGVFTGLFLKRKDLAPQRKAAVLAAAGVGMILLGHLWGLQFPIIKKIWTSSYVLVAGGWSCVLVAAFYLVVDIWKVRWWTPPFLWIGSNALAVYMACRLFDFEELAERFVGAGLPLQLGAYHPLLIACTAVACVVAFARWLYKHEIFIRI